VPPDVALTLADEAAALATKLIEQSHDLLIIAKASAERRAQIKQANRQRFCERFGRWPTPARGNKTP
jgi:hypothetical protein